ncbi:MAG: 5-oxoprolinase subunit PxpB [Chloroflexi bacterium]|nr:MAG: 5-oxoprolinase subunit PxpB [Chloroflexota bacterium]
MPRFQPAGDSALLVTFANRIDLAANRQAHMLARAIARAAAVQSLPGLGEAVPGYITLLVHYNPLQLDYAAVEQFVRQNFSNEAVQLLEPRRVEVPVIYGSENGPDLAFVAGHCGLSEAEVIRIHAGRDYPVYMMGFTPGFPYLGGMDPAIAAPRLSSPRSLVPGGSVGIAGEQTGIYPVDSPGGWRIIGRTPLRLFDPTREPPFLLSPGDLVRFVPLAVE